MQLKTQAEISKTVGSIRGQAEQCMDRGRRTRAGKDKSRYPKTGKGHTHRIILVDRAKLAENIAEVKTSKSNIQIRLGQFNTR